MSPNDVQGRYQDQSERIGKIKMLPLVNLYQLPPKLNGNVC